MHHREVPPATTVQCVTTVDPFEQAPARRDAPHRAVDEHLNAPSVVRPLSRNGRSSRVAAPADDSWSASSDGLLTQIPVVGSPELGSDGWPAELLAQVDTAPPPVKSPTPVKTPAPPQPAALQPEPIIDPPIIDPWVSDPQQVVVAPATPPAPTRSVPTPATAPAPTDDDATAAFDESYEQAAAELTRQTPSRRNRPRVRKVQRVVRRVDPWGVFKLSLLLFVILYVVLLIAGVLLWRLAASTGTIDNIEGFVREALPLKEFTLKGDQLFRGSWAFGAIMVIGGTGFAVTMAILFNLLTDLVGGVKVTVLEEEVLLHGKKKRG